MTTKIFTSRPRVSLACSRSAADVTIVCWWRQQGIMRRNSCDTRTRKAICSSLWLTIDFIHGPIHTRSCWKANIVLWCPYQQYWINASLPSDVKMRHTQVTACCLMAPSHNLNQFRTEIVEMHYRTHLMKMNTTWHLKISSVSLIVMTFLSSPRSQ